MLAWKSILPKTKKFLSSCFVFPFENNSVSVATAYTKLEQPSKFWLKCSFYWKTKKPVHDYPVKYYKLQLIYWKTLTEILPYQNQQTAAWLFWGVLWAQQNKWFKPCVFYQNTQIKTEIAAALHCLVISFFLFFFLSCYICKPCTTNLFMHYFCAVLCSPMNMMK